jgi:hypothetical protein
MTVMEWDTTQPQASATSFEVLPTDIYVMTIAEAAMEDDKFAEVDREGNAATEAGADVGDIEAHARAARRPALAGREGLAAHQSILWHGQGRWPVEVHGAGAQPVEQKLLPARVYPC